MSQDNSPGERTEEATPRRRQEARQKGTVARSSDLNGAIVLLVVALGTPVFGEMLGSSMLGTVRIGLSNIPHQLSLSEVGRYSTGLLGLSLQGLLPFLVTLMMVGLLTNFAQVGFVLSGEALNPKLSKINPFTGLQRLFSIRTSVESIKTLVKAFLFGYLAWGVISANWSSLLGLMWLSPMGAASVIGGILHQVMVRVAITWLVLGALDYFFQRKQTDKQMRMTKDELKREMRESETSPELKGERYKRARKLAKGRLLDRIKIADAVITNPTHFAVAVQYDRSKMHAPMVVAKGQDYLALKIRTLAKEHKIPIVPNPPLARQLYKLCEVGDFIPREMFSAVAEVLAYVYKTFKGLRGSKVDNN